MGPKYDDNNKQAKQKCANGGIGQPLALLMKKSLFVTELSLYDITNVAGVAADLSHIETRPKVIGYTGPENLKAALDGVKMVLIAAGVPRKPGMTRDDLFDSNASIVADLSRACGKYCPEAMVCVITNPINSTVPIAAEILKKEEAYNPKRLFGVTTLDVIRANTFIAHEKGLDICKVSCPVVGGHSGNTMVPIFSQCNPIVVFPHKTSEELVARIRNAGTDVVNAKAGEDLRVNADADVYVETLQTIVIKLPWIGTVANEGRPCLPTRFDLVMPEARDSAWGSATLSMAYAGARFVNSLLHAMKGRGEIVECAFVESDVAETDFFASPVLLGPNGIEQVFGIGNVNKYETELLKIAIPELKKNIQRGKDFAAKY
ncbi:hypothetical protein ACTXT7_006114 [Hymenolepis weldensis]